MKKSSNIKGKPGLFIGGFVAGIGTAVMVAYALMPYAEECPACPDPVVQAPYEISSQGIQPYFCPEDGCADRMIELFNGAGSSIDCAVYSFTHDEMSQALVDAHSRGVDVRVFMDDMQAANQYAEDEALLEAGIEVRLDERSPYMHNKYCIIDMETITTGSFNFSKNADTKNDENFVIINSGELAGIYEADFSRLWQR